MSETDYVKWENLRALSTAELYRLTLESGPAAINDAARQIIAEREAGADRTARLNAAQQGSVPRDISD